MIFLFFIFNLGWDFDYRTLSVIPPLWGGNFFLNNMPDHPSAKHTTYPIWHDATRLMVEIENSVRRFSRYHKYTLGTELRRQAMAICRCIVHAAAHRQAAQEADLERLVFAVEDIKTSIQLARELQALASKTEFARLAELAVAVGKQSGGWRKSARAKARPVTLPDAHKAEG